MDNNGKYGEQLELIVVDRICGWHPVYFGTPLVMGTMLLSKELGTFGSHGMCPACVQMTRKQNRLSTKEAA